jgi:LmbE family N-acetylglucosaminyl deacetylase
MKRSVKGDCLPAQSMSFRIPLLVSAALILFTGSSGTAQEVVKYQTNSGLANRPVVLVAHQDDWQLFMGDVVAERIRGGDSVTFIYVTAGDDGRDSVYWLTRERAALQSVRIASGMPAAGSGSDQCSTVRVLAHAIRKCVIAKTDSYFLRIPDGKRDGKGFVRYQYQSLRKLRANKIAAVTAIDSSATYKGWTDLTATISSLIGSEKSDPAIMLHVHDPSKADNPHDHFDHRMVGLLAYDIRKSKPWNTRFYVGYAIAMRAANRSSDQARDKESLFLAYNNEMMRVNRAWSAYAEHPAFYSQCMLRTYARTAPPVARTSLSR